MIAGGCAPPTDEETRIPITTSSEKALKYYLKGRELAENLRTQQARQYFQMAVSEDPDFAIAYLSLAPTQPTNRAFLEAFDEAVALKKTVSEGEQLMIEGLEAGINGKPLDQRRAYKKLTVLFPQDERAHNFLGNYYFSQQEFDLAIAEFERAISINPSFASPYNMLGYSYARLYRYDQAETAFKKYIELIPYDPNPYDSYAELLLRVGKFDASIEYYKKALEVADDFLISHIGIATNLYLKGDHEAARKQLQVMYDASEEMGYRRAALLATAITYIDEGRLDDGISVLERRYSLAESEGDTNILADDLVTIGYIHLEAGRLDDAKNCFERALELVNESSASETTKSLARIRNLFAAAVYGIYSGDLDLARENANLYFSEAQAAENAYQIRVAHQLAGMIALKENDFEKARLELNQANQYDPYNEFRLAEAHEGLGNLSEALELYRNVVHHNVNSSLTYAIVRTDAIAKVDSLERIMKDSDSED